MQVLQTQRSEKSYTLEVDATTLKRVKVTVRGEIDLAVADCWLEELVNLAEPLTKRLAIEIGPIEIMLDCQEAFLDTFGLRKLQGACEFYQQLGFKIRIQTNHKIRFWIERLVPYLAKLLTPISDLASVN